MARHGARPTPFIPTVILLVSVVFSLSGCEVMPPKPVSAPAGSKIAVVSLLGPDMRNTLIGTTIFTTRWTTSPAPEADIDGYVLSLLTSSLRLGKGLEPQAPGGLSAALVKGYERPTISPCCARRFDLDRVRTEVAELGRRKGADFVLVVVDWQVPQILGRGVTAAGYGYVTSTFLGLNEAATYVSIELLVVDTHKAEIVSAKKIHSNKKIPMPTSDADYSGLLPEDKARIVSSLREQLDAVLEPALREMTLIH